MLVKRGDTIVEVLIAITIYSIVSIFTITAMKLGIQQGETSLELSQARIEVSAQADAIRFIHNSFLAEREYAVSGNDSYKLLWNTIVSKAIGPTDKVYCLSSDKYDSATCSNASSATNTCPSTSEVSNSFIINPRVISPTNPNSTVITGKYVATDLYPRLIFGTSAADNSDQAYAEGKNKSYTNLLSAEGIWVVARKSASVSSLYNNQPEYYDFHIYTCWHAPGASHPTTTGTIIRLYNPSLREAIR